jgi:hypothetical protein
LLVAISGLAAALLLAVTARWGLGVSPDSVAYLDAARNLRHGDGVKQTADQPLVYAAVHQHAPYPLFWWAPFYPLAVAGTSLGPWGQLEAARVLNALLLAASVALVGWLVHRVTCSRAAALISAGVLALSPVALELYSEMLSEPLYVPLSYVAIALVAYYLAAERRVYFWGAATATALALTTRYAAMPLLAAAVVPLLVFGRGGWWARLAHAAAFACLSLFPLLAWLARNWHLAGTATGREFAWHPLSANRLAHGIDELTMLIVPADVPAVVRGPIALAVVVAVVAAGTRIRGSDLRRGFNYYLLTTLLLYVVLYPIFLLASISTLDGTTNLGHRFLFPIYPGMVVLGSWALVTSLRSSQTKRLGRVVLVAGVAAFICGNAVGLVAQARRTSRHGNGYSGRVWASSPAIARIRALPANTIIYSDSPELIYFRTRRVARSIPATVNAMSGQPNRNLSAEIQGLRRRLTRNDVFVLFTRRDYRWYLEDAPTLAKELGLLPTSRTADAIFYHRPE